MTVLPNYYYSFYSLSSCPLPIFYFIQYSTNHLIVSLFGCMAPCRCLLHHHLVILLSTGSLSFLFSSSPIAQSNSPGSLAIVPVMLHASSSPSSCFNFSRFSLWSALPIPVPRPSNQHSCNSDKNNRTDKCS